MIQLRDEVSSTQDFLIAWSSKILVIFITILYLQGLINSCISLLASCFILKTETPKSPLTVSNMIEPRDEVYSKQDLPILGSSNIFEVYITIFTFIMTYKVVL